MTSMISCTDEVDDLDFEFHDSRDWIGATALGTFSRMRDYDALLGRH